ncbi:PLP-dependent cysteine synthase family protein [Alteromonas sp. ASW11-130]|uniref:PLP-dependent cysteine synthase family protein n=1 Tax=Alteromonas sp. ASW11-130 TaxID=3015775 RepID=UPI00224241AD|nr:cysteine synthase [Alteromonas sp. ASW11-130]MCW8091903.1 cysteine synthase [Alteromonas sp. ASW11-130]
MFDCAPSSTKRVNNKNNIYNDITETIGKTPLVRMSKLKTQLKTQADLLAKIEFFNPAGSIKDRPALAMIKNLITSPHFTPKTEIIEASSGNNGVACAWLCAMHNIPITIVIPEHMSIERQKLIKHFGGNVLTTPKAKGTKGAIDKAKALVAANPNAISLDQFGNHANPQAHSESTAEEIWQDSGGSIDVLVCGVGTGGTLTGVARKLKEYKPSTKIVAVEPASCPILSSGRGGVHNIQGLSSGHVPEILDTRLINKIIIVRDDDAIAAARKIARLEGLAVGISSGATLHAAAELVRHDDYSTKTIVVILADGAERYFSTPLFD